MAPTSMADLEKAASEAGATEEDLEGKKPEGTEPEPKEPEGSTQPEGEGDTTDDDYEGLPESYFGTNIHEYADEHGVEAAKGLLKGLEDANRVANKRIQEIADYRKKMEEEATPRPLPEIEKPQEVAELTDEELLGKYGYDPELMQYEAMGKPILDMLRRLEATEARVASTEQATQAEAWEREFFGTLDGLQKQHGDLPYSREDLEVFAAENRIFDPDALYWRIMGPIKAASEPVKRKPVGRDKAVTDLKRAVGSGRKRSGAADKTTTQKKGMSLMESYLAAKQEHKVEGDPFYTE